VVWQAPPPSAAASAPSSACVRACSTCCRPSWYLHTHPTCLHHCFAIQCTNCREPPHARQALHWLVLRLASCGSKAACISFGTLVQLVQHTSAARCAAAGWRHPGPAPRPPAPGSTARMPARLQEAKKQLRYYTAGASVQAWQRKRQKRGTMCRLKSSSSSSDAHLAAGCCLVGPPRGSAHTAAAPLRPPWLQPPPPPVRRHKRLSTGPASLALTRQTYPSHRASSEYP
jgi:hypothetical protein